MTGSDRFWEDTPLDRLTREQWEALCDGCGKCCLNKLEDEDTGHVALTRVSCRLLDGDTCLCSKYATRHDYVPECITLTPKTLAKNLYWLPATCAYVLRFRGQPLPHWHPLLTGDPETVHKNGHTLRGKSVNEILVNEDDWENYIIED